MEHRRAVALWKLGKKMTCVFQVVGKQDAAGGDDPETIRRFRAVLGDGEGTFFVGHDEHQILRPARNLERTGDRLTLAGDGFQNFRAVHAVVQNDLVAMAVVTLEAGVLEIAESGDLPLVLEISSRIAPSGGGRRVENRAVIVE